MKIVTFDNIDSQKWQQLVEISPNCSFFQSKACYDIYCNFNFLEPVLLGIEKENELIALLCGYIVADGGTIKRHFSRRAIFHGGPLLHPACKPEDIQLLLSQLRNTLNKKAIYIEIRNYSDYSNYKETFQSEGFSYQPHNNFKLNTNCTEKEALNNLGDEKKRQLRQSIQAGIYWEQAQNTTEVYQFYTILETLYKKKIKRPLFHYTFFEKLWQSSGGKIILVKDNTGILGGIVVVHDKQTVYEWYICANETKRKGIYPSVVATWAGIQYAVVNKFSYFDFMGAGQPDKKSGIRDFKARFGAKLVEHGRFLYICNQVLYMISKSYIALIKRH